MLIIKELYAYREMIAGLVRKDLRGRYKGSVLGFLWTFLNPLMQLLVYTFAFQIVLKNPVERYYMHLFSALVPWIFFSSALTAGSKIITGNSNMIKKIYFPREVLPIAYSASSLINMFLSFIVIIAVIIITGSEINILPLCFIPAVSLAEYMLVLGTALITSSVNVYFRDFEHIAGVLNTALMYVSPVVYGIDYIPENMLDIYMLVPMTPIIISFRDIFYYARCPEYKTLALAFFESTAVFIIGLLIFERLKKRFAEEI